MRDAAAMVTAAAASAVRVLGVVLVCNLATASGQEANKIGLAPNAKSYYSEGDVIALQVRRCASLPLAVAATRPRAAAVVALGP